MGSKKAPKNRYVKNSRLSERKFRELPRLFRADAAALSAASPTGLNRNTVNRHHGMPGNVQFFAHFDSGIASR